MSIFLTQPFFLINTEMTPQSATTKPERIVFLDYLRFIACFMVILVHCIEPFYLGGEGTLIKNAGDAAWSTFLDSALRAAVPLFVMASSYLLFPLKYDTGTFFKKRFVRVCIPLIIWSLLYALIPYYGSAEDFGRGANLQRLLLNFNPHAGHLWFLYMLLGVYLLMPLLSPWIEKVSKRGEQIFLGVWAFTTLTPFLRQAASALIDTPELWGEANWNEYGMLYYVSGFVGYLVLGHYVRTYLSDLSWKKTLMAAIPMWIVGYAVTAGWFWFKIPDGYPVSGPIDIAVHLETSWQFCGFGVALTTIAYFLVIKKITASGWFYRSIILPVSKISYGVYLMHMFILVFFHQIVGTWALCTPLHILVTAVLTFVTCSVVAKLISFIPGSKYLLG